MIALGATALAQTTVYDFNTPTALGVPPAGWVNDSQAGSPASFQVVPFQTGSALFIKAAGNTWNRVKVKTTATYTTGIYSWRVYVPPLTETGASSAIGGFLYWAGSTETNAREIDFEIGYGTAAARATYGIPAGRVACLMSVQADPSSGTPLSTVYFQPSNSNDHIQPGNWYTFMLELTANASGKYVCSWTIQKDGGSLLQGRPNFTCGYGPSTTPFNIHCSRENFSGLWIGDHQPTTDQAAYFDNVSYSAPSAPPTPVLITGIESDSVGTTPYGANNAWTRFGAAYSSLSINTVAANAAAGSKSLLTSANWANGATYGVRYNVAGASVNVSSGPRISYKAKYNGVTNPQMRLVIVEADGDIWTATAAHTLTTSYAVYKVALAPGSLTLADASGGGDLDLNIAYIGFDFLSNGAVSGSPQVSIDEIYWKAAP